MTSFLDSLKSENNVEMGPPVDKVAKVSKPELNPPKNLKVELDNSNPANKSTTYCLPPDFTYHSTP